MRKFGLIGEKLGHSFSKNFFTQYFKANDIDAEYLNFELGNISEITDLFKQELSGLNVTIPYKESVMVYLDEVSDEAVQIGAVNCISFNEGKVIGYNTDAYGFHNSIKPFLTNKHERALIFGTGGASKAVAYVLRSIGVEVFFISRSLNGPRSFGYEDINEQMINSCKLIVNCTPIGMYPDVNSSLPIVAQAISEEHLFVDLVYNPELTKTMEIFLERGATAINGEAMLKLQAMKSWQIWNS
ncbi:MAG: shikimate dehydrogenase [Bacteroidetes bacterium]|nr:MAG: shikimate dehydrogenase [Bacteroidota bacterium]